MDVALWEWDIITGELKWSPDFLKLIGYERDEVEEKQSFFLESILHPNQRSFYEAALDEYFLKKKYFKIEVLLKTKLRSYRWFKISGKALFDDGSPIYMVGSIEDINIRKSVDIDRRLQELILEEVAEVAKIGVWEAKLSSDSVQWSQEVFRIHEVEEKELMTLDEAFSYYLPESQEQIRISFLNTLRNKDPYDLILQIKTAKGHIRWIRSICKPLLDERGEIIKLRGIIQDIDDMMREQKMQERKTELIQDQNDRLMNFAHIVSHNLRSHASNLHGLTRLLNDPKFHENELPEIVGHLGNVSVDLTKTIDELSELVQVQTRVISQRRYQSFEKVLANIEVILKPEIQNSKAQINTDFKVEGITFVASYLSSIFLNLVSNAIKYRSPNQDQVIINIRSYLENGHTVLEVEDNGRGIDLKKYGSKVFGLYETFHYHSDSRGVGLYLVKNQLESQNAKISVRSSVNEGTCFKIEFPD